MTVKGLIEILQTFNPDDDVCLADFSRDRDQCVFNTPGQIFRSIDDEGDPFVLICVPKTEEKVS